MSIKPDDISDADFELMVKAMLACRETHLAFRDLPHSMSTRAKPFRDALAKSEQARLALLSAFNGIDDDEEDDRVIVDVGRGTFTVIPAGDE